MESNFIVELNLEATIGRQNNKCKICPNKIKDGDNVYFRMDQAKDLYEVYCEKCGKIMEQKDREAGIIE